MKNNFLTEQDHGFLQKVQCFFDDLQLGMSAYQIQHFVLNDEAFPLPDSKYHQAKLELYSRWQKVTELQFSHRKNRAQIRLLQAQQQKWRQALQSPVDYEIAEAEAQIELLQVEIEQMESADSFLKKNAAETFREMRVFHEVYENMKQQLVYTDKESAEANHWQRVQAIRSNQAVGSKNPIERFATVKNRVMNK